MDILKKGKILLLTFDTKVMSNLPVFQAQVSAVRIKLPRKDQTVARKNNFELHELAFSFCQ